jgi:hypothetical protein
MAAANAHMRLLGIMAKVVKYVYPIKTGGYGATGSYYINYARAAEVDGDLSE